MKKIFFLSCMMITLLSSAKKWDATYIGKLIAKGDIDKVIQYYQERYYGINRDPQDAFKIADLYVRKKDYPTAMQWYEKEKQLINTSKLNLFNYANTYRLMGDYQKALDGYLIYAAQTGDINKVMDLANQCERVLKLSTLVDNYKLENYTYNTSGNETNVAFLRTNPVYVTMPEATEKNDHPSYTINQVVRDFENFAEPVKAYVNNIPATTVSSLTYTLDGNMVAFSAKDAKASKKKGAKDNEKIYIAENLGGSFLNAKPFPFNMDGYSFKNPAFNSEGTALYFSSNQTGGSGGFDIWKSTLEKGKWTKPVNLGKLLNTKYDEINPFIVQDGKDNVLYFSSDRDGGFGGFDIYNAKYSGAIWQGVEMQPAPINSAGDDVSIIYDSDIKTGYFSSNRSGGKGGFDVYRFTPYNLRLIIHTTDSASGKAIDYALVNLNENNIKVNEGVTDDSGNAVFQIGKEKHFDISVSKDNYKPVEFKVSSAGKASGDSIVEEVLLKQDAQFSILNGATNNLSLVNYIFLTGHITDASTGKPARFAKMRMLNYTTKRLRELDVEADGRYEIKLMLNNEYKIIFENQDNKITDEITTYGLDKNNVKVRDYLLTGNKFTLLANKIYTENNLPPTIKINKSITSVTTPPANINEPVTPVKADTLAKAAVKKKSTVPIKKSTQVKTAVKPAPKIAPVPKEVKPLVQVLPQATKPAAIIKDTVPAPKIIPENKIAKATDTIEKIVTPVKDKAVEKPIVVITKPVVNEKPKPTIKETILVQPVDTVKEELATDDIKDVITTPVNNNIKQLDTMKGKETAVKEVVSKPVVKKEEKSVLSKPEVSKPVPVIEKELMPATPIKADTAVHPDISYKIQLDSYAEGDVTFPKLENLGKIEAVQSYGQYIYRLGDFYDLSETKAILEKVRAQGYFSAFILQYNKSKITNIIK